jgi:hypothetical protein
MVEEKVLSGRWWFIFGVAMMTNRLLFNSKDHTSYMLGSKKL